LKPQATYQATPALMATASEAAPIPPPTPMVAQPEGEQLSLSEQAGYEPSAKPVATTWQRVVLAPGIELHHLAAGAPGINRLATRIIEAARHVIQGSRIGDRDSEP
jgi:hypothetical protein